MGKKIEQGILPLFDEIMAQNSVVAERRPNQPRGPVWPVRTPTSRELLFPLDINFKNRLGKWIAKTEEAFPLEEILPPEDISLIKLYLYPQPPNRRWLSQREVMAQVFGYPRRNFKNALLLPIVKIARRERVGQRAIEVLKLPNFIYKSIVRYQRESGERIQTIDQLRQLPSADLQKICGARPIFEELKKRMKEYFPDWDKDVVFRGELP